MHLDNSISQPWLQHFPFVFRYPDSQSSERQKHQLGFVTQGSASTEAYWDGGEGRNYYQILSEPAISMAVNGWSSIGLSFFLAIFYHTRWSKRVPSGTLLSLHSEVHSACIQTAGLLSTTVHYCFLTHGPLDKLLLATEVVCPHTCYAGGVARG